MSNTAVTLTVIAKAISILNGMISLFEDSEKYRDLVANAILEGRDISDEELAPLKQSAIDAINAALED